MKAGITIIEDNVQLRTVLNQYIVNHENYELYGSYGSIEEALPEIEKRVPRLILLDIGLPGMDGIEGTKLFRQRFPKVEIIIISVINDYPSVFNALCAGVSGYLTKNIDGEGLYDAIEECLRGGAPMSTEIAKMVVTSFRKNTVSPLSARETEVLSALAGGYSYAGIGEKLFISKETVKSHIKSIYLKLEVSSKNEAITVANKNKYI